MGQKRLVFLLLLLTQLLSIGYGNNNKEYYENLLKSLSEKYDNQNHTEVMQSLMQVKIYAKDNKLYDMQVRTLNQMGIVYTSMASYDKAIECYLEAYQIASKLSDKKYEIGPLNNIGQLYFLSNNMDKAEEYVERAYKIAIKRKDNFAVMQILHNLIIIFNNKENLEQAEKYLNIAMERIKKFPENPYILPINAAKADYLYSKKEYDMAEQLALEVLNQNTDLYLELEANCLFLLSKIYYQKENYPKAISYAKDAMENSVDLQMTIEIYEHLSTVYRADNSFSFAWQCQDYLKIMKDSLLQLNSMNQILRGQVQFELNNLEKTLIENKAKQKRNQLVSMSVVVVLIAVFLLFLYIRYTKSKQLKIVAQLERRTYKNEIEMKNRQLISRTLLQLSKNELIEEIINMLSHIPNQLENAELQSIIKKLQSQLKDPTDANWNSFLTYFEQTNPRFLSVLKAKHPKLTANDIRLSSYIYLNLDTKEISKLLHITPESYKKKKKFLARKMEIPTAEIYSYLSKLV